MHHETLISPRFGDLDFQGHVNNVAILDWLQHARWLFYHGVFDLKLDLVVARVEIDFLAEADAQEEVVIKTWIETIGNTSMKYLHQVWQGDRHCASSTATIVQVDNEKGCPVRIGDVERKRLEEYEFDH